MKISASLWSAGAEITAAVRTLRGTVDAFHVDVMDGRFVPTRLFGTETIATASRDAGATEVDVHLMVAEPDHWLAPCAAAGADHVTFHPEGSPDPAATLAELRRLGLRAGIAIALDRPLAPLLPLIADADRAVVMGTELGRKGLGLSPHALTRVRMLRALPAPPEIYVDGGIRRDTVPAIAAAGADGVVAGSILFGERPWPLAGTRLRALARTGEPA